ncbi:hypothetical protein [Desulfotruncus alcoholivorax]|uniref:hypothetical protein n=1 Tax=Desulfotruncus alcoholivorax TaxID=265477 RepID=UPI000406FA70|nr:hypothetical protein [Desulfotruncus alcoholivorax]
MSFGDTVRVAVRSLQGNLITQDEAIETIIDAAHNLCVDCENETRNNLKLAMATLERAVEDERRGPAEVTD